MPIAKPAEIAEALKVAWNASSVRTAVGVDATRANRPRVKVADLADGVVRVVVAPGPVESVEAAGRGSSRIEYAIDLGIQKKIDSATSEDTQIDILTGYLSDTLVALVKTRIADNAMVSRATIDPLFSVQLLDEHRVFTGVVRFYVATTG